MKMQIWPAECAIAYAYPTVMYLATPNHRTGSAILKRNTITKDGTVLRRRRIKFYPHPACFTFNMVT
jgi:hypothetical protein